MKKHLKKYWLFYAYGLIIILGIGEKKLRDSKRNIDLELGLKG